MASASRRHSEASSASDGASAAKRSKAAAKKVRERTLLPLSLSLLRSSFLSLPPLSLPAVSLCSALALCGGICLALARVALFPKPLAALLRGMPARLAPNLLIAPSARICSSPRLQGEAFRTFALAGALREGHKQKLYGVRFSK